eukprot:1300742-Amorphochlora_amoeboformis.AAC.1
MATHAGSPVPYYFHRCRFVPWKPSGVVCLAWTADGTCLGVKIIRNVPKFCPDFNEEVLRRVMAAGWKGEWRYRGVERLGKIPGSGQPTISRLVWLPNIDGTGLPRLFSSGLT